MSKSIKPEWTRTSYSQFGEDAVIQAWLRNKAYSECGDQLRWITNGFYVDIGGYHPEYLSNTLWLYQQGWRGINVEPSLGTKNAFDFSRPEDTNLQLAISDHDGELTFFSYGHSVLNTVNKSHVDWTQNPTESVVPCLTLKTLLDKYLPSGKSLDILSVDVEGHDLIVLRSNDWSKYRPELALVELHQTSIESILQDEVYAFMLTQGYKLYAWTPPSLFFQRCN
jgi:FkbM family methyltransferase